MPDDDLIISGLVIRPRERVVFSRGQAVDLTAREFEIVHKMAEHPGWVFSAEQLAEESDETDFSPESVSVHVSRLRHKLTEAGAPDVVETVRGIGYRLHPQPRDDDSVEQQEPTAEQAFRDAWWRLEQAVRELDHSGDDLQRAAATEALDEARRILYAILSE